MSLKALWRWWFLFLPLVIFFAVTSAMAGPAETPLRVVSAETSEYDEATGRLTLSGNVVVVYREYRVAADTAVLDTRERTVTFRGRVRLSTPERMLEGSLMALDLRTSAYDIENSRILLQPQDLQMSSAATVYVTAGRIHGIPGSIFIESGGVTTCNLGHPHYLFDSRQVSIFPGRLLKALGVSAYAFGHKLITLPGLTIPLRTINERSSRLTPTVGQSVDEGYFLKTAYTYALGTVLGTLNMDLMSRKGIGVGVDQPYNTRSMDGDAYAYYLNDQFNNRQDFSGRLRHQQHLGEFNFQFNNDYRRNSLSNLFANNSNSSLISDFTMSRDVKGVSTILGVNRSTNSYAGTDTGTWTGTLSHTQRVGDINGRLNLNLSQPFGDAFASAGRLSSRLDLARNSKIMDLNLTADNISTLGSTANYYTGVERLPELSLTTSSDRLWGNKSFARSLPLNAELSFGNLQEGGFITSGGSKSSTVNRLRTALQLEANPRYEPQKGNLSIFAPLQFGQYIYKEDEAQWALNTTPSLTYRLGKASDLSLNYSFLGQNGFTPFRFDALTEYNHLSLDMRLGAKIKSYAEAYPGTGISSQGGVGPLTGYGGYRGAYAGFQSLNPTQAGKANISLGTGYDFENDISQDLIIRSQYQPTRHHMLTMSTGYDWLGKHQTFVQSRLRDIRASLKVDYGPIFQLGVGTLWDTNNNNFANLRGVLNTRISSKWQLQALYGKTNPGFGVGQQYTQVMLTRDLHCWEASAIYRTENFFGQRQSDFRMFMSIKAFPVNKEFGVSTSGQYLTTDIGELY